jgi:hypothetical protein
MSKKICPECKEPAGPRTLKCKHCSYHFGIGLPNPIELNEKPVDLPASLNYNKSVLRACSLAIDYQQDSIESLAKEIVNGWGARLGATQDEIVKTLKKPLWVLIKEVQKDKGIIT